MASVSRVGTTCEPGRKDGNAQLQAELQEGGSEVAGRGGVRPQGPSRCFFSLLLAEPSSCRALAAACACLMMAASSSSSSLIARRAGQAVAKAHLHKERSSVVRRRGVQSCHGSTWAEGKARGGHTVLCTQRLSSVNIYSNHTSNYGFSEADIYLNA